MPIRQKASCFLDPSTGDLQPSFRWDRQIRIVADYLGVYVVTRSVRTVYNTLLAGITIYIYILKSKHSGANFTSVLKCHHTSFKCMRTDDVKVFRFLVTVIFDLTPAAAVLIVTFM